MPKYRPRLVDDELTRALRIAPAVHLVGPRACGKTTSALQQTQSSVLLDPADQNLLAQADLSPSSVLMGETPRLIDEWQLVPKLWSAVRRSVDQKPDPGQFIMCGSAWPDDTPGQHSGAGRFIELSMRTMSLLESGESTGQISLQAVIDGKQTPSGNSSTTVEQMASLVVRGGWPGWLKLSAEDAQFRAKSYLDTLSQHDFPLIGGSRRAPDRFTNFVRAYATLTGHPAPLSTVGARLSDEGIDVGRDYPSLFHDFAKRMFIVDDLPAWSPAKRSKTRLIATPKRYLTDASLAAAAMDLSAEGLLADPETFGYLFESLVVHDLKTYAHHIDARLYHYRTKDATAEIDAVVEKRNGSWAGVEVKLGYSHAEAAAKRLAQIAATIKRPPAALIVVVPGGATIRLDNGVWIIPITTLAP